MFKINDVVRIASETHMITRTHHPVTAEHPDPRPLTYAVAGCGRSVDGRDVIPWAPVAPDARPTCKGCAGTGPAVVALTPDRALDVPHTEGARGWLAGRKGKGATMHGIPDPDAVKIVKVAYGRANRDGIKATRDVPMWESACGEAVTDWDAPVKGSDAGMPTGAPRTRYAPHMTDAGIGARPEGVRWCGNCAATYKGLRGNVAPKGVLTSKSAENMGRHGETTDAQERANARAAWLGRVLPLVMLTLGESGVTVADGNLLVAGKGGPVHACATDRYGRMMLVCRTGAVLSAREWDAPKEGRGLSCAGCREAIFDGESGDVRPLVLRAMQRGADLPDVKRFAPVHASEMADGTASLPDTHTPVTPERLVSLANADAGPKRFPFDRPRGIFRTGTRAEMRSAYEENDKHGMTRLWNKIVFTPSADNPISGRRELTMVIHRDIAERLGFMVTDPNGDRVTGWTYLYTWGALPKSVSAVLTREQRARLFGGGKRLATRTRTAQRERGEFARNVVATRNETLNRRRKDDGTRVIGGALVYGTGRDFSDRAGSRVI